jgi:hypothetical protein
MLLKYTYYSLAQMQLAEEKNFDECSYLMLMDNNS